MRSLFDLDFCRREPHLCAIIVVMEVFVVQLDTLLTARAVATNLGCSLRKLERHRARGDGPPYVRVGGLIRYPLRDLEAWLAARRRLSTADLGPRAARSVSRASAFPIRPPPVLVPPRLAALAERLAAEIADDALTPAEAARLLHCASGGSIPDWIGIRAVWHCHDTATEIRRARDRAEWAIRRAVRPLFAAGVGKAAIDAAAARANRGVLLDNVLYAVLLEEQARAARRAHQGR